VPTHTGLALLLLLAAVTYRPWHSSPGRPVRTKRMRPSLSDGVLSPAESCCAVRACARACACANAQLALEDLRAPPATARDGSTVSFGELKALVGLPKYHEDAKALAKRHAPSTVRRAACAGNQRHSSTQLAVGSYRTRVLSLRSVATGTRVLYPAGFTVDRPVRPSTAQPDARGQAGRQHAHGRNGCRRRVRGGGRRSGADAHVD
jgi:hypothetical protein